MNRQYFLEEIANDLQIYYTTLEWIMKEGSFKQEARSQDLQRS